MAIIIWGPVSYPVSLDTFYASNPVADGSDQVIDNHPNTIASSIAALENKLGVTGGITSGLGATAFYSVGLGINPSASNIPTVWVNTSQELIYSVGGVDTNIGTGGVGAGTTGELITWDVSGNRDAVAVGTATHVLTSNGVGVEPTFQAISTHAEVTLATSATTGGMSISTQEIGNQAAGAGIPVAASSTDIGIPASTGMRTITWDVTTSTWWASGYSEVRKIFRYDSGTSWTTFTNSSDTGNGGYTNHIWFGGELWTGCEYNSGSPDAVWSYAPGTDTWTPHGGFSDAITPKDFTIHGGNLLCAGHYSRVWQWVSGSSWTYLGTVNSSYRPIESMASSDGDLYGISYGVVYIYSAPTTWTDTSCPISDPENLTDWNGTLVCSGRNASNYPVVYKYESSTWTQLGADLASAACVQNVFIDYDSSGTLYCRPSNATGYWYKYDSVLDSWSSVLTETVASPGYTFRGEFNPADVAGYTLNNNVSEFQDAHDDPVNGYLTSVDWNTFNDKADTLVYAENLDIDDGIIETVDSFDPTDDGIIMWHYQVSDDATNMRCGTVMAVWDDSAGTVDDVQSTTAELGTTSDLALSVDYDTSLVRLRALPTGSSNWKVRVNRVSNFEV